MALKLGTCSFFAEKRVARKKILDGLLIKDSPITDAAAKFEVEIYNATYDHINAKFDKYFSDFRSVMSKFACRDPSRMFAPNAIENVKALAKIYKDDVDASSIIKEFVGFQSLVQDRNFSSARDVMKHMVKYQQKICFRIYMF